MAFAQPADCRVAAHRTDPSGIEGNQRHTSAHPGCDRCRLAPGMAAAHYNDVEFAHYRRGLERLAAPVKGAMRSAMFHVEHPTFRALFADAETAEHRIEHVLGGGIPQQVIERYARYPQILRHEQRITHTGGIA